MAVGGFDETITKQAQGESGVEQCNSLDLEQRDGGKRVGGICNQRGAEKMVEVEERILNGGLESDRKRKGSGHMCLIWVCGKRNQELES